MSTYTAEDFKRAEFARHPDGRIAARVKNTRHPSSPWTDMNGHVTDEGMAFEAWIPVQEGRPLTADDITDEMVQRAKRRFEELDCKMSYMRSNWIFRQLLAAALTEKPRPAWLNAPAVQAWHRSDHRAERDGTPGKPRIWSPDYGTVDTWSTPSLPSVHWSELVDVVPLAATGADVGEQS